MRITLETIPYSKSKTVHLRGAALDEFLANPDGAFDKLVELFPDFERYFSNNLGGGRDLTSKKFSDAVKRWMSGHPSSMAGKRIGVQICFDPHDAKAMESRTR